MYMLGMCAHTVVSVSAHLGLPQLQQAILVVDHMGTQNVLHRFGMHVLLCVVYILEFEKIPIQQDLTGFRAVRGERHGRHCHELGRSRLDCL